MVATMCLCLSLPTAAQAERMWLAGAEAGADAEYAYLGTIAPWPGGRLGEGLATRLWVDWLHYTFESGGREVEADAPGAEAALGYLWSFTDGGAGAYLGAAYRNTSLDPSDAQSEVEGAQVGAKVQIEARRRISRWRTEGIAAFTTNVDAYWARGRLGYATGWGYTQGVELVVQGGPDYEITQAGLVFGDIPLGAGHVHLKAGVRHTEDVGDTGYIGVELVTLP